MRIHKGTGLLSTATFAAGCFWGPEAVFGALEGVVRTRVGYAGGTSQNPTYRSLEQHMETLQLDFDPGIITYQDLLDVFFRQHNPGREPWKRQYTAAAFYHTAAQEQLIYQKKATLEEQLGKPVLTEINPYQTFYSAEDRHQKYYLQRQPQLLAAFRKMYPRFQDLINSTAAARVNGYLYASPDVKKLLEALGSFGLDEKEQQILLEAAMTV